jgi:phage terminase small subunit
MPGPGKKANHLKVVSGTERADREPPVGVQMPTLDEVPGAPDWLGNAHAVKEWNRLAPIAVANKLLTEAGLSAFGVMCATFGEIVKLTSAGMPPTGNMIAQYRALANDFGLTPVAQGKVKPSGDKDAGNKFAKYKNQPAG